MITQKIADAYSILLASFDDPADIAPLRLYNAKDGVVSSLAKHNRLPQFFATYRSNGDTAIIITVSSKGYLSGNAYSKASSEDGKSTLIKSHWSMYSDEDFSTLCTGLYNCVDKASIVNPTLDKINHLMPATVTLAEKMELDFAVSDAECTESHYTERKPRSYHKDSHKKNSRAMKPNKSTKKHRGKSSNG